ncbi:MAG: extracellular solute-binding protein [Selenomonadaceae bacterium]|nr:extracellular solute-binding protein [Selenomonadaceae bacterium]
MLKKFLIAVVVIAIIFLYYMASRPTTLTVGIFAGNNWDVPQGETYAIIDEVIENFEAENPGVKVKYVSGIKKEDYSEWLAEQFISGSEPDIFFVLADDFNLYASIGALMNLEDFIAGDKNFSVDVYYPAAFKFGQYENISYALPCESTLTFMFVNKTLLAKEGVAIPKNDWTWEDFLKICRKVTRDIDGDGVPDQFGCYDYSWQQAAISNGVKFFRDDGKTSYFADSRMEEAVKFIMELRGLNGGFEVSPKDFDVGRVAFRPFTFAEYRTYKPYPWRIKKYSSFEWDCIKMPAGSSGGNISVMETLLVGMSSRTHNKNLAWALLKKFCYDEKTQQLILKKSQALPVRRDVIISAEAQEIFSWETRDTAAITPADISVAMDEAIMPFKFKNYNAAMLYADTELTKIIAGIVPFNNALNKLQKEINALLQY